MGLVGLVYHGLELKSGQRPGPDAWLILFVRLLAIICGVYLWLGKNWARWLAVAWMAYHVVLSAFHSVGGTVLHALLLIVLAWFLFRPNVTRFFREQRSST
jgi:hypothetical protein